MSLAHYPIDQFRDAMANAGLSPPETIHDDGKLYRFATNGRRGDDSGWYVYHSDARKPRFLRLSSRLE